MSLQRFVYYCAMVGGWAALLAWIAAETLVLGGSRPGNVRTAVIGAIVGAAVSGGLTLVSGTANPQWKRRLGRLPSGLISGGLGGAVGAALGHFLYVNLELPRSLGWMIMGLAIGAAEGFWEGSRSKFRNGLIGGGLGGLLGGWLFDLIAVPGSDMAARATAFVILGVSVGALIGLAHVVLKEAWLTVVDGFGPGRELILTQQVTVLGRGDHLPLPFLGYSGRDLESEHLRITRGPGGDFTLEDNHSRIGTLLNGRAFPGPVTLQDGDLIRLGANIVRFHLSRAGGRRVAMAGAGNATAGAGAMRPPPPPPGGSASPPPGARIPPPPPPPASQ